MNNDILIQSVLIGYSIICIKPLVSSLNIKNRFVVYGSSFAFFWGSIALISIISIMVEIYLSINVYNPLIIFLIIFICCLIFNNFSENKYNLALEDFFVFIIASALTYFSSYFYIPRIRGGDGFWLTQTAFSLANNNLNIGGFAGGGHRAPLWILLESYSLMASNYLLFNFQILSAIFALMILISTLLTKLISRNEKIVLTLLVLTLITSPAYVALSIYFEIHPFASLLIILLWCFLDAKKYTKNNYFLNSILLDTK